MADRAGAKAKAQAHGKSKKKGAMDGMTVKGGHKLSVKEGAGLTEKGRKSINRRTGSNLKLLNLKADHVRNHSVQEALTWLDVGERGKAGSTARRKGGSADV